MNPFVGKPYEVSTPETWGKTNYYKLNEDISHHPVQTRIGGKKSRKKMRKMRKTQKHKKFKRNKKKGGSILDERYTFPGLNTTRNIINSGENMYNTFTGKHLNVSPSPLNQPIYSGST